MVNDTFKIFILIISNCRFKGIMSILNLFSDKLTVIWMVLTKHYVGFIITILLYVTNDNSIQINKYSFLVGQQIHV